MIEDDLRDYNDPENWDWDRWDEYTECPMCKTMVAYDELQEGECDYCYERRMKDREFLTALVEFVNNEEGMEVYSVEEIRPETGD